MPKSSGKSVTVIPVSARSPRIKKNRQISQQLLREKLAAGGHVGQIGQLLNRLEVMRSSVAKKQMITREDQARYITETGIIKTKLDGHFRILNKFLPDLRSTEQNDQGQNPLAEAIAEWTRALDK